ncbi:MAG: hypothetical protein R3183_01705 [Oleiphilaceae bacterium]|nr:hypothetical protein [Oleiphilaceae bacterium]
MKYLAVLVASLIMAACSGGGGSESNNIENTNIRTSHITRGAYQSIANPLDITISFAPNSAPLIIYGQLEVFFDLNENGTYDDGDVAVKAGNQVGSSFINLGERWTDGGNFVLEYLDGGNVHAFKHPRPFNFAGPWRVVSDVGGFQAVVRRANSEVISFDLTLRINLDFSDNTQAAADLKAALRTISSSTPRMARFTNNASLNSPPGADSFDYLPGENLFTTENSLEISDPAGDYTGPEDFYDLIGIELVL